MKRCLLLIAIGGMLGCGAAVKKDAESKAAEPKAAVAQAEVKVDIKNYDGVMALVKSHQGKIVVMDAWSTSCEPCIKEFPGLVALHKKYGPGKVACISLSCDYIGLGKPEELVEPVLKFLKEQGATFDNVLSSDDSDALFAKLKLPSIPAVFIYNPDGTLNKRFENEFSYRDVEAHVATLVK